MTQRLASVTLLVRDYEEAIAYYTQSLGFTLVENTALTDGKRWVRIAPPGSSDVTLLLARASTRAQVARVGDQTGGRVFLFLQTSDFWQDHRAMRARDSSGHSGATRLLTSLKSIRLAVTCCTPLAPSTKPSPLQLQG